MKRGKHVAGCACVRWGGLSRDEIEELAERIVRLASEVVELGHHGLFQRFLEGFSVEHIALQSKNAGLSTPFPPAPRM